MGLQDLGVSTQKNTKVSVLVILSCPPVSNSAELAQETPYLYPNLAQKTHRLFLPLLDFTSFTINSYIPYAPILSS